MKSLNGNCDNGPSPKYICINKSDCHTKFVIYRSMMNEGLSMDPVNTKASRIPDYQLVVFTHFRLTSHSLGPGKVVGVESLQTCVRVTGFLY